MARLQRKSPAGEVGRASTFVFAPVVKDTLDRLALAAGMNATYLLALVIDLVHSQPDSWLIAGAGMAPPTFGKRTFKTSFFWTPSTEEKLRVLTLRTGLSQAAVLEIVIMRLASGWDDPGGSEIPIPSENEGPYARLRRIIDITVNYGIAARPTR